MELKFLLVESYQCDPVPVSRIIWPAPAGSLIPPTKKAPAQGSPDQDGTAGF